jgi:UDP-N-acetylmuramate dehydrogenase
MSQPQQLIIKKNTSLKALNTFGIDEKAALMISFKNEEDLYDILDHYNHYFRVLGGGSNILLTTEVDGLLLKNEIKGIQVIENKPEYVVIDVGAGENWHDLVQWAVKRDYGGLENLSLIPGTVGAAPIQNIGAYGVELRETFVSLDAVDLETTVRKEFKLKDCQFGYRESIFKTIHKEKFCITYIRLRLTKPGHHVYKTEYGDIKKTMAEMGNTKPSVKAINDAVIKIRSSKLPDPKEIGNAGSFFKNPELEKAFVEDLIQKNPLMPHFDAQKEGFLKIPAAWLIEQCGWKGKLVGNTGVHAQQALVLVNHKNASGTEILQLAKDIQTSVKSTFGIDLEMEVNVW